MRVLPPPETARPAAEARQPRRGDNTLFPRLAHAMLLASSGNGVIACTVEHCRMLDLPGPPLRELLASVRQQTDDMKFAMLTCAHTGAEPRRADQARAELGPAFVPRVIATDPDIDAFRWFCEELAGPAPESTHTVLVAHLTGGRDVEPVAEQVRRMDAESAGARAPLVILSPTPQITPAQPLLAGRPSCHLITPFTVARFIDSVRPLLQPGTASAAA